MNFSTPEVNFGPLFELNDTPCRYVLMSHPLTGQLKGILQGNISHMKPP